MIGRRYGSFVTEAKLGEGGGGVVFRARDVRDGSLVALKLLRAGLPDSARRRFQREARILSELQTPHLARLVECSLDPEQPFLAMQFIDGTGLDALIVQAWAGPHRTGFPEEQVLGWARDLARGLALAHEAGVIHRDLKPSNVLVDSSGLAVIVDFGLARREISESTPLTGSDAILGTLSYLTPEHWRPSPITRASDVYQWGMILYEMLTGKRPYSDRDPAMAIELRCARGVPAPLVPAGLRQLALLVERALSPDREDRPADGTDLLDRLRRPGSLEEVPPEGPSADLPVGSSRGGQAHGCRDQAADAAWPDGQAPGTTTAIEGRGAKGWVQRNEEDSGSDSCERLGPYRIVGPIGQGGMGTVLEGRHQNTGERVAIKVIRASLVDSGEAIQRFRREIRTLMKIFSPRIVRLLDTGETRDRQPYLVMEYLPGETLSARLDRAGPRPTLEALEILSAIAEGVGELHRHGLIHRDLKSSNIILTPNLGPRILDLGIVGDLTESRLTRTGEVMGTLLYAAPEMLTRGESGVASDVFALGLILYELITARRDFRAPDAVETLRGYLYREGHSIQDTVRRSLDDLLGLFRKSTALDPLDRHADACQFRDHLDNIRRSMVTVDSRSPTDRSSPADAEGQRHESAMSHPVAGPGIVPAGWLSRLSGAISWALHVGLALIVLLATGVILTILPEILRRSGS